VGRELGTQHGENIASAIRGPIVAAFGVRLVTLPKHRVIGQRTEPLVHEPIERIRRVIDGQSH